jgi:hypothetical protein
MTKEISTPINKKEIRKQLSDKLEIVLLELKDILGDKKFHNRIKKAVKVLTAGLEEKNTEEEVAATSKPKAVVPKKVVTNKKTVAKKVTAPKKVATPKKAVPAKKTAKSVVVKKAIKKAVK